jgi:hypothetical protein
MTPPHRVASISLCVAAVLGGCAAALHAQDTSSTRSQPDPVPQLHIIGNRELDTAEIVNAAAAAARAAPTATADDIAAAVVRL